MIPKTGTRQQIQAIHNAVLDFENLNFKFNQAPRVNSDNEVCQCRTHRSKLMVIAGVMSTKANDMNQFFYGVYISNNVHLSIPGMQQAIHIGSWYPASLEQLFWTSR
jgi:hypothetical protein